MANIQKFKKYCPEHYTEIENYAQAAADNFVGWHCHHRNGEQFSKDWLIRNNMYYGRNDPHEFKFVTLKEHHQIHQKGKPGFFKGKHHTPESKRKISEHSAHLQNGLGKIPWNKGLRTSPKWNHIPKWRLSDETRKKHAEIMKEVWKRRKEKV